MPFFPFIKQTPRCLLDIYVNKNVLNKQQQIMWSRYIYYFYYFKVSEILILKIYKNVKIYEAGDMETCIPISQILIRLHTHN